jgi:O-antigen/teichoic acid export membrane protein
MSSNSGLPSALLGVAIAAPCMLLFWLARRGFYVRLAPRQAVGGALVYFAVVLGGLLAVCHYGHLSPFVAFLLMAAGAAVTAPMMIARLRPALKPGLILSKGLGVIRRHWGYGRWALASAVAIWFSGAIFYPLVSAFYGLGDAGTLKALMNFSSPVGQAFAAMSLLSLPYAAGIHHQEGSGSTHRLVWRLTAIYAGGTALYWLVIVLLRHPIVTHLYAGKYSGITGLIPWVAFGSVLRISATAQAVTLRAMHSPALVFVAYVAASVVAVLVGIPCTWAFGLQGAVFAMVLSSAVALAVALLMVHRSSTVARFFKH